MAEEKKKAAAKTKVKKVVEKSAKATKKEEVKKTTAKKAETVKKTPKKAVVKETKKTKKTKETKKATAKSQVKKVKKETFKIELPELKQLLEAGAHFGHAVKRWNPKMAPYIYKERNGIHIFDLFKTVEELRKAVQFLAEAVSKGKTVVMLGTKGQAVAVIKEEAERLRVPYVVNRWVGGTLTNWEQIKSRIDLLREMREKEEKGEYSKYTKKEQVVLRREIERLERMYGGLVGLKKRPEILFVVDPSREKTAVKEARDTGTVVVALADTNADPDQIDYIIPANDDALKSVRLIVTTVAKAIEAGQKGGKK